MHGQQKRRAGMPLHHPVTQTCKAGAQTRKAHGHARRTNVHGMPLCSWACRNAQTCRRRTWCGCCTRCASKSLSCSTRTPTTRSSTKTISSGVPVQLPAHHARTARVSGLSSICLQALRLALQIAWHEALLSRSTL